MLLYVAPHVNAVFQHPVARDPQASVDGSTGLMAEHIVDPEPG